MLDNLVYGHRAAVPPEVPFYQADLGDEETVGRILVEEKIAVVMHFAAFAYVGESVNDPLKYYLNNVASTLHLLKAMLRQGVNRFVFSSSCADLWDSQQPPHRRDDAPSADQPLRSNQARRGERT